MQRGIDAACETETLEHHTSLPSSELLARISEETGHLLSTSQYQAAEQRGLEFLRMAQQCQDVYGQAMALSNIAIAQRELERYQESLRNWERVLAMPQRPEDQVLVYSMVYEGIGNTYNAMKEYAAAIEFYQRELDLAVEHNNRAGQQSPCIKIGVAYFRLEQYTKAIEYYEKHLDISQQLDDWHERGHSYRNLGSAHLGLGQYATAVECFKQYIDIVQQSGDRDEQTTAYLSVADGFRCLD